MAGTTNGDDQEQPVKKVPITILTGFLGSGKTTLLNHILQDKTHGMKFAIIENEYGAVDIDADLVTMKEETKTEIIEMINGCICCNVRGDLIPVVKRLIDRKDEFDCILIETTGMADPSPVIQTFFLDQDISSQVEIDGVVTVVDAQYVMQHLGEVKEEGSINETQRQLAFADKILLNKTDLVNDVTKAKVRTAIRTLNARSEIIETKMSVVEPKRLFGMQSFNIERVLNLEPGFLDEPGAAKSEGTASPLKKIKHDSRISSVAFQFDEDFLISRLQRNIQQLISESSENLYRYKAVVSVKGVKEKFALQGVHMVITGGFVDGSSWKKGEKRTSKFVFIGVDLDHNELREIIEDCRVQPLRYTVGTKVKANAGGWEKGTIIKLWDEGNPYRIQLNCGRELWAPEDSNMYVKALKKSSS